MNVDHRGFNPTYQNFEVHTLDATLSSDLKWDVSPEAPTLWELQFGALSTQTLPSFQLAVRTFNESVWEAHKEQTLGVILYRGGIPPYSMDLLSDMLHQLGALLPDEVPAFALFDVEVRGSYLIQLFSKELFPHIHLGFRHAPFGALQWKEKVLPIRHDAKVGVVMPLRTEVTQDKEIDSYLAQLEDRGVSYRILSEMYLTEEWDEIDDLILFSKLISKQGVRKIQGFIAAGGRAVVIGEPLGLLDEVCFEVWKK